CHSLPACSPTPTACRRWARQRSIATAVWCLRRWLRLAPTGPMTTASPTSGSRPNEDPARASRCAREMPPPIHTYCTPACCWPARTAFGVACVPIPRAIQMGPPSGGSCRAIWAAPSMRSRPTLCSSRDWAQSSCGRSWRSSEPRWSANGATSATGTGRSTRCTAEHAATTKESASSMKVGLFEQAPYRHLPDGFEDRYDSVVTPPYFDLVEPEKMQESLSSAYAEMLHAARAGFDAVCVTEHSQSAYDVSPNPDLLAAAATYAASAQGPDAATIVMGRSLGHCAEPLKIA